MISGPATTVLTSTVDHVWCPSPLAWGGRWWLFHSRWPRTLGFEAWVSHSRVAVVVADHPCGPFLDATVVLDGAGQGWDADVAHNPQVLAHDGRLWLYYMGNRGPAPRTRAATHDKWWTHRNHQRIGVAWAERPRGPWRRLDRPLIDLPQVPLPVIMASNPAVAADPAGGMRMILKCVLEGPRPFGGQVVHLVAEGPDPDGPFTVLGDPVLMKPGVAFPAEDPFLWHQDGTWHLLCKDQGGHFCPADGPTLARFRSPDGRRWRPSEPALVSTLRIATTSGERTVQRLERPALSADRAWMYTAALEQEDSALLAFPVRTQKDPL